MIKDKILQLEHNSGKKLRNMEISEICISKLKSIFQKIYCLWQKNTQKMHFSLLKLLILDLRELPILPHPFAQQIYVHHQLKVQGTQTNTPCHENISNCPYKKKIYLVNRIHLMASQPFKTDSLSIILPSLLFHFYFQVSICHNIWLLLFEIKLFHNGMISNFVPELKCFTMLCSFSSQLLFHNVMVTLSESIYITLQDGM